MGQVQLKSYEAKLYFLFRFLNPISTKDEFFPQKNDIKH